MIWWRGIGVYTRQYNDAASTMTGEATTRQSKRRYHELTFETDESMMTMGAARPGARRGEEKNLRTVEDDVVDGATLMAIVPT